MNDLRSRSLSAVPDGENDEAVPSTPPRVRPSEADRLASNTKMSRRQSIEERARQDVAARSGQPANEPAAADSKPKTVNDGSRPEGGGNRASRRRAQAKNQSNPKAEKGPQTRPTRRRENEDEEVESDKFPWQFDFDNDEPEELQASSPLLSRAFRASIG